MTEWTTGGTLPCSLSNHAMHGSSSLLLGQPVSSGEQGDGQAWAYTTLYVPPDWTRPALTFRYQIFTNDIRDYSDFFVAIQDGSGLNHLATVLRDGYPSAVAPLPGTDLGWREVRYDLSAFKGQHIRIVFSNRDLWPNSLGIWTYLDDVRVLDAGLYWQPVFLPSVLARK